jgi:suppressor for copper-sensitivity B
MRESQFFGRATGIALVLAFATWSSLAVCRADGPRSTGSVQLGDLLGKAKSLPGLKTDGEEEKPVVHAALTPSTAKNGSVVTLSVTVLLPSDTYTYSTTQAGSGATKIDVSNAEGLEPQADFEADHAPTVITDPSTGKPVEKFARFVTWLRPYVVTAENLESVRIGGTIDLKFCNSMSCRPFTQPFRARLVNNGSPEQNEASTAAADSADTFSKIVTPAGFGGQSSPARLSFVLSPKDPKPGDTVTLGITMHLESGWHTYSTTQKDGPGSTTTSITLIKGRGLRPIGDTFRPDRTPELTAKAQGMDAKEEYHGDVTWTRRFKFEPKAGETGLGVEGKIHYGVCNQSTCLPPHTESFALGDVKAAGPLSEPLPDDTPPVADNSGDLEGGFWFNLGALFLGGMLLNVMPCVLPVLAIKVLSFVQQAGESRSRIFMLNVAYTAGVLAVFLTLATLAVGTRFGLSFVGDFSWGGLFQQTGFNLVMACVVFAMGLSLLGVFEIPVPGMVGSAAGGHQREGFPGAFFTGVFATLLATPCIGPFLGTALFWSVRQATAEVYLALGVMGLGMAAPYLALGLFPQFIKWLPKPGTWMIRFKEFSGFVLLASVIFIVSYTDKKYTIPALVMLLGVALALWMIGNLYDFNSHIRHKTTVRISALVLAALICWIGFELAGESKHRLPWEPFSESRLTALMKENKTVLVDFTADWCLICQSNERLALNTKETEEFVKRNGIVPLLADFTNQSAEIKKWLDKFKQAGVPLTVILPAGRQSEPIVLRSVYSQGTLLEKLKEASQPQVSPNALSSGTTEVR